MCKVMMMAGVKPDKVNLAWKFAKAMAKPMSWSNRDGIGYAAITADGQLFGERWLNNDDAFKSQVIDDPIIKTFGNAVESSNTSGASNTFGNIEKDKMVAITLHTRTATSPKGMLNTHPFVDQGVSIIHNGVIRNQADFKLDSTCDSEAILRAYLQTNMSQDAGNLQSMADLLMGYYSVGVLANTDQGPILDVFRYNASQNVVYITELETWVLATSDMDIKDACKELGFTMGQVFSILNEKFIRINAVTGKEIAVMDFKARTDQGYSRGGQHYGNFPQSNTATNIGTNTKGITDKSVLHNAHTKLLPNRKKNTEVGSNLMSYFNAGRVSCTKLTEREVQEVIMETERHYGRV